jgi:mersacidin/lichenicidin family type 2 lantibiotic
MSHANIIRAWKDEAFRNSLSAKERALLPDNPAGMIELSNAELEFIVGGRADTAGSGNGCGTGSSGGGTGGNCCKPK